MIKGKQHFAILNWEVAFLMIKGKHFFAIYFWKIIFFFEILGKTKLAIFYFSYIFTFYLVRVTLAIINSKRKRAFRRALLKKERFYCW